MRKNVFGRQLSRDKNERAALFKGLMSSLVLNESIKTTEAKAKAIKGEVEKLVTRAKKDEKQARKTLGKRLNPLAIEKMLKSIAPRFVKRNGGYTRIIRLGKRFGDDAQVVLLEWIEKAQITSVETKTETKKVKIPKKEIKKEKTIKKSVKKEAKSKKK